MGDSGKLEIRCLHSLVKVFPDEQPAGQPLERATALKGEVYSFQVAFRPVEGTIKGMRVAIDSPLADAVEVRNVGLSPSEFPIYPEHDGYVLRDSPGLYPDPLLPIPEQGGVIAVAGQWRAVWVSVRLDEAVPAGVAPIRLAFETATGERLAEARVELDVLPVLLPPQRLIHTEWFHADCLADYYGVDVFSEAHWALLGSYIQNAVRHGINMILTPLFTPPLDTAIGGERTTVQLIDVERNGDQYRFGFERLSRWVELCRRSGVEYFEFSHLFTQWGAKHAPKIVGNDNGTVRRLFGWDTDASGSEYQRFLDSFLPELVRFIRDNGLEGRSYFHVSDEPNAKDLESYRAAAEILHRHVGGFPVIDALSDYAFYEKGLVSRPIPATDHIEPFLANEVPDLWTYYCCGQYLRVSNRFFCFPSARNRILGFQLYKYRIAGFLHWGFNFWNTQYSLRQIDPYRVTDAEYAFPSGDAYVVYPGEDGPIDSLRYEVMYEALQDLRALELLESRIGRDRVMDMLEGDLERPITFEDYPRDAEWLLAKRETINRLIAAN